jgi:hypothetical protein
LPYRYWADSNNLEIAKALIVFQSRNLRAACKAILTQQSSDRRIDRRLSTERVELTCINSLLWVDQQRVRSARGGDYLDAAVDGRCDLQLEFLNRFDWRFSFEGN